MIICIYKRRERTEWVTNTISCQLLIPTVCITYRWHFNIKKMRDSLQFKKAKLFASLTTRCSDFENPEISNYTFEGFLESTYFSNYIFWRLSTCDIVKQNTIRVDMAVDG